MLLPSRAEATAAHREALVIVINNVWLIWLIKQSGNPLPVGNTTSSRITKITSELSALVTPLSDKELDSHSRSKNTFIQHSFANSVLVRLKVVLVLQGVQFGDSQQNIFRSTLCCKMEVYCTLHLFGSRFGPKWHLQNIHWQCISFCFPDNISALAIQYLPDVRERLWPWLNIEKVKSDLMKHKKGSVYFNVTMTMLQCDKVSHQQLLSVKKH